MTSGQTRLRHPYMLSYRFLRENAPWLLAGLLLAFGSNFGQTFFISLFGGEYRRELGLTDGEFGMLYTVATLASATLLVNTGWIADRVPMRRLGPMVLLGLAGVCLLMSQVQNIWLFGLAIFGLRYAGQGMLSHIEVTAIARWFVASRGRALAVASWGHPIGEGLLPPMVALLLTQMEWRMVWIVCAILLVCVLLPLFLIVLKGERVPTGTETAGKVVTGIDGKHWTRPEVFRHRVFWLLIPALMASPMIGTAGLFHQAHIAETNNWTLLQFTAGFSSYAVLSVVFSLIFGMLLDRFSALIVLPFYLVPLAIGMLMLSQFDGLWVPHVFLGMIGASAGAGSATLGAMWAELYGTKHLGSIRSLSMAAMVFSSALGPGLTGVLIDWGINFNAQCIPLALYVLAMGLWIFVLLRPVVAAQQRTV